MRTLGDKVICRAPKVKYEYTLLAMVVVANTFFIGIVLMAIGLVALYIGTIHTEVINRPLYVVREKINFE